MNILELSSWTAFKNLCITTKNLNCQYTEGASIDVYGPDANGITWHTSFPTSGADYTDFDTNHRAAFNWAIGSRSYPFSTPDFDFSGDGISFTATKNSTTQMDHKILTAGQKGLYINGGELFTKDAVVGDWIEVLVVDKDGLVAPVGTVLKSWVQKWHVSPSGAQTIMTIYAGLIPGGMYLRVIYHSIGTVNDVNVALNLSLHKPI